MNYEIGDRVRFKSDHPATAKPEQTGYREPVILENGKEGTIVSFHSSGNPIVKWDAATYRIYRDMETTPTGIYLDKETAQLGAFECDIHTDNIEPISPPAATRPTTPAAMERETHQRQHEKVQSVVSYMVDMMVIVDASNRFDARERIRMAEIIVEHFNKSDPEIAELLRASGFDLGGMMSPPAKQVADIKRSCHEKYSETLRSTSTEQNHGQRPERRNIPISDDEAYKTWQAHSGAMQRGTFSPPKDYPDRRMRMPTVEEIAAAPHFKRTVPPCKGCGEPFSDTIDLPGFCSNCGRQRWNLVLPGIFGASIPLLVGWLGCSGESIWRWVWYALGVWLLFQWPLRSLYRSYKARQIAQLRSRAMQSSQREAQQQTTAPAPTTPPKRVSPPPPTEELIIACGGCGRSIGVSRNCGFVSCSCGKTIRIASARVLKKPRWLIAEEAQAQEQESSTARASTPPTTAQQDIPHITSTCIHCGTRSDAISSRRGGRCPLCSAFITLHHNVHCSGCGEQVTGAMFDISPSLLELQRITSRYERRCATFTQAVVCCNCGKTVECSENAFHQLMLDEPQ